MFYLRYLRSELVGRRTRTILTLVGLALGVALVITITGLARGLDRAQKTALNPLSTIGTDLTVTLSPQQDTGGFGRGGGGQLIQANQSAVTDLSKLGKPGTHFVHDFFLPGTQLTFPQKQTAKIASLPGVAAISNGLVLSGVHQEGVVPKIVAKIKAGGQQLNIRRQIKPPTAAEAAAIQACFQKLGVGGGAQSGAQPGTQQGFGGGGRRRGGGFFSSPAARKCLPARMREFRARITTPRQTLKQLVSPPQTNIKSSSYTIGGVDPTQQSIGLVTPSQLSSGRFLSKSGGHEALVSAAYAKRKSLKLGSTLDLNGTTLKIVGLVRPPLGGQTADVYIPLALLQKLASQTGLANVVLVRATSSSAVANVQKEIEQALGSGAQVASAKQVAASINGSLVDAANLSHNLGLVLAIIAAVAAFLVAALLTLSSIGKRVREIGTLKALGWSQRLVVRQVLGECLATGVAGGLAGVALGALAAAAIGAFGPSLSASSTTGAGGGNDVLGLGQALARTASTSVSLTAPLSVSLLLFGFALALAGGLIAGGAGALRAARLRPADALRQME
ncbi:MAG TPA: ABC transporter permease [Gaiellaceae bacterium]|nr:ABC transporter permease [Gaiellaceae bacterium]